MTDELADTTPPPPMRTSARGREFVQRWEGYVPSVYKDTAGIATACWGHVVTPADRAWLADGITREECETVLANDLGRFERAVCRLVRISISQHQFDALVSFAFNCGVGALESSTALRKINSGDLDAVPAALALWRMAVNAKTGVKERNTGLYHRRIAEGELWSLPDEARDERAGITDADVERTLALVAITTDEIVRELEVQPLGEAEDLVA